MYVQKREKSLDIFVSKRLFSRKKKKRKRKKREEEEEEEEEEEKEEEEEEVSLCHYLFSRCFFCCSKLLY